MNINEVRNIINGTKWHTCEEAPNGEKAIIIYDITSKDIYEEICYYSSIKKTNLIWIYAEDILPKYLKKDYIKEEIKRGKELEERYS